MVPSCVDASLEECAAECAERLVLCAREHGVTVCTAESLTAGMVASLIAGVPGASDVLLGGAATYCDAVKHRVLGVAESTLERFTAVSVQTAREMAEGALQLFGADVAVSLTGYAGPGPGMRGEPAGTVYLAVSGAGRTECVCRRFPGERNEVRLQASICALDMLVSRIESL